MIYNSIQVSRVQYYISTPVNVQHAHHQKSQFPPTTIQLTPFTYFTPTSSLLITILFSVSTVCFSLFWFLHIYLFFFSQLILLSIILSRPIHLVANSNISSFPLHIYHTLKLYFKSFFVFHPNNLAGLKLCYMVLQFPNIHVLKNFLG